MAPSDLIGILASLALAVPPIKDQAFRYQRFRELRRAATSRWPALRREISAAYEERRNAYDGIDSLLLAAGALGLLLSFVLKAAAH